jgi:hypothetical protein
MGGRSWNAEDYKAKTTSNINAGTTFGYDRATKSRGASAYAAHKDLDPKYENAAKLNLREARDSDDHPNSNPIVIAFDATGSMGSVPTVVQKKLGGLFGLLLRKGYIEDPQIAISAYGDAFCDRVPLQISQFESDNRVDENLNNLFLEGGGGGNSGETQSLLWYYLINHMETDAWQKRNKKGYLFMIADEVPLQITAAHVKDYIGDGEPLSTLVTKDMAKQLQEKWDVVILLIDNMSARSQGSEKVYKDLFGSKNVLIVENPETITEVIGLVIGVKEGMVDTIDQAEDDLKESGSDAVAIKDAIGSVGGLINLANTGGAVAKGSMTIDLSSKGRASRL